MEERIRSRMGSSIFGDDMHRFISRLLSHTRAAPAGPARRGWLIWTRRVIRPAMLVLGVVAFIGVLETRVLDSQSVAWMLGDDEPIPGARLKFSATAYCKGQTTASGVRVRTGIAAADPTLLPVGSVVNVDTGDAKYNGIYTVMDTGPEVQGRELDLYIWSCHEALRFGRKPVRVTVLRLGWDPQASTPSLVDRLFRRREVARATPRPEPPAASAPMPPSAVESQVTAAPPATPLQPSRP
jgi:3D (Asp-Asp-Asp) domain-containing protein